MSETNRQRLGRTEAREIILEAAARVFNQRGRATTVEDIAREAGYSTSALYKHFSNKEDILSTLWKQIGERMVALFRDEPPVELRFVKRLKWTLYRMAQMAEETREFYLAGMTNPPMAASDCPMDRDCMENFQKLRAAMIALMERGIAEGVLRPNDAEIYSMALGGHLRLIMTHWALFGPFPLKPRIEQALEIFLMGAATAPAREEFS